MASVSHSRELPHAEMRSPPPMAAAALSRDERVLAHLAMRCAGALAALAASLEGLEILLERLADVAPGTAGVAEAREVASDVIAMLGRDGPPLLLRTQALRMHLHIAGFVGPDSLGGALASLQRDIQSLADLTLPLDRSAMTEWFLPLRQGRAHAMRLAAEFLSHGRALGGPG